MIYCSQCRHTNDATQHFCGNCGTALQEVSNDPTLVKHADQGSSSPAALRVPPPPPTWSLQPNPTPVSPTPRKRMRWVLLSLLTVLVIATMIIVPFVLSQRVANKQAPTAPVLSPPTRSPVVAVRVRIDDSSSVLNQGQVRAEGEKLPYPLYVYTTNTFTGTGSAFDQDAINHLTSTTFIVIGIDTVHKHLAIFGGKSVPLSQTQYAQAVNAFANNFHVADYTAATIAAIHSLQSSLQSAT